MTDTLTAITDNQRSDRSMVKHSDSFIEKKEIKQYDK